jgi:hypothetical protein
VRVTFAWEQEPLAENRVVLADTRDRPGVPRPALHWTKGAPAWGDRQTVRTGRVSTDAQDRP